MAPRPGTRDSQPDSPLRVLFAAGRLVGFLVLAGVAVLIVAAAVLVPAYARLARAHYERACQQARTADLSALAEAQERMIFALPDDEVLTMRLAMSQEALSPSDRILYSLPRVRPTGSPDLIKPMRHPRPAPPPDWLMRLDARLRNRSTRRGLLLVAFGCLVLAIFLFAPPEKYHRSSRRL